MATTATSWHRKRSCGQAGVTVTVTLVTVVVVVVVVVVIALGVASTLRVIYRRHSCSLSYFCEELRSHYSFEVALAALAAVTWVAARN